MKIRLLERIRTPELQGTRGDVVEVDDARGIYLESHGFAAFVNEPKPEAAPASETPEPASETKPETEAGEKKSRRAKK